MRPLLLFFVAVFIFEATARNCLSSLASSSKKLVKPKINGPYSRFLDNGKYVIIGRDHVTFWLKIPNSYATELTINFKVMSSYHNFYLYIQLFGDEDGCLLKEKAKAENGQSGSISIDYDHCECELYENEKGESYLLMELWTDNIVYHDMSFEQDGDQLEMYLDEKEAEKWNKMPTCPNIWINKKVSETQGSAMDIHGLFFVSEMQRRFTLEGTKPFYQKNGNDYINLDKLDMVLFLERKDPLEQVYVMVELQDGKKLNDTIEIKIEVDGAAPDKYYELINGGKGLKITFKHTECLQVPLYIGLVRYVIHTSIPGMLRVSFYDPDGGNKQLLISGEAL
uniref:Uncharacterized protein n=1 Tax=Panagrolaimus sp. PS1159 TaxID=55785 RepID=A0AC35GTV7_9BILA